MKVLQIINSLGTGGAEKLLLDTLPAYNELGISMELLVLNGTIFPFLKELKKQGTVKVHNLGNGSVYSPMHVFRLAKFLKKYDVIHVHLFPALYWVALAKGIFFNRTPLIFTEHNTSNRRRENPLFKVLDRWIYSRYKKIITISSEVDAAIKEHLRFKEHRFEYIQNGAPVAEIGQAIPAKRSSFGLKSDAKILIQVASFTPQKDQTTLLKALSHLDDSVKLLLVGDGPLREEMQAYARELNVEDRVQFLGIRMDVPSLLRMADVVVLSTHYEGLSLSSIEGLASGRPFIASEAPGVTNMLAGAGLLFPIGDDEALANQLKTVLESDTIYEEIAEQCLARAKDFSIDKMIDKHRKLYAEVGKKPIA